MKFKSSTPILFAVAALGAFTTQSALAVDGIIDFTGEITANTCVVTLDDQSTGSGTVTLPVVSASSLPNVSSVTGTTPFRINLSNCSITSASTVTTYFEPGAYVNSNGRLTQTAAATATNVEIQLLNAQQDVVNLNAAASAQNASSVAMNPGDTAATLSYYAQYYATGSVTPGTVISQVSYSIIYD